jgi:hypothetical protein
MAGGSNKHERHGADSVPVGVQAVKRGTHAGAATTSHSAMSHTQRRVASE